MTGKSRFIREQLGITHNSTELPFPGDPFIVLIARCRVLASLENNKNKNI